MLPLQGSDLTDCEIQGRRPDKSGLALGQPVSPLRGSDPPATSLWPISYGRLRIGIRGTLP